MASIRDVASMSGVSTATVSNVLNSRCERVGAETSERVLAAVRALRYRPVPLEQSQSAILTQNLALVCCDLSISPLHLDQYFGRIFDGILEEAALQGWSVTVSVERMWSEVGKMVRRTYDGRCDGVIVLAPDRSCGLILNLVERGVPVITIGTAAHWKGSSSVDIDNELAGRELTGHLVGLGHTSIAYFGPTEVVTSSFERCRGYCNAMQAAGLATEARIFAYLTTPQSAEDPANSLSGDSRLELVKGGAEGFVRECLESAPGIPSAVICWNDALARQVIPALERKGLGVPADVSVVGIDGTDHSLSHTPPLTTVRQPFREIGKRAVNMLISRILNPALPDETVRFKAELVVRGSTGPPPSSIKSRVRHIHSQGHSLPKEVIPNATQIRIYAY